MTKCIISECLRVRTDFRRLAPGKSHFWKGERTARTKRQQSHLISMETFHLIQLMQPYSKRVPFVGRFFNCGVPPCFIWIALYIPPPPHIQCLKHRRIHTEAVPTCLAFSSYDYCLLLDSRQGKRRRHFDQKRQKKKVVDRGTFSQARNSNGQCASWHEGQSVSGQFV